MNDDITLTKQQQDALDDIMEWYKDPNAPQFKTLRGFAGTGKTTLLDFIVKQVRKVKKGELFPTTSTVAVTATTNKAVKVLRDLVHADHYSTIHSMLNIKPHQRGRKEIFKPDYDSNNNINSFDLVIIDECSMVSSIDKGRKVEEHSLLRLIKDNTRSSVKVLFCGDPAQLQPINEPISQTFEFEPIELTDVVRHANSIAKKAKLVRNRDTNIELGELLDGEDIILIDRKEIDPYFEGFRDNPDQCRMLCWTNAAVKAWNKQLRLADFGERLPAFFPGDIVMANAPCAVLRNEEDNIYDIVMANSQEGVVLEAEKKESHFALTIEVFNENHDVVELKVIREEFQEEYQKMLEGYAEDKDWYSYWKLKKEYHDIRHCYALTTHKSQGSTFDRVIMDWRDITKNWDIENRNQLIYVAMTRAAKQVLIYA